LKFPEILLIFHGGSDYYSQFLEKDPPMTRLIRSTLLTLLVLVPICALAQSKGRIYHSFDEMTKALHELQSRYGDIVHLESLGKTSGGRDIWVVGLRKGDPAEPRAMLIVGGVEPTQIAGSNLALQAIEYFASQYGKIDGITQLLEKMTLYVIPRASPDATEAFFEKPKKERSVNQRPTDDDRDGLTDEDDVEDLNGDGVITSMRVEDPQGEWMVHPDDPRILRKANLAKNERGAYALYTEGVDNDKDEQWNEDPRGGVNFNKNFTFNYDYFTKESGVYQVSESEARAVADFVFAHPTISVIVSFSPNDNLMKPWKSDPRAGSSEDGRGVVNSVTKEDEQYYQFIGKNFQEMTGFKDAPPPEKGHGAFSEWAYYHAGRWSFSTFPWWAPEITSQRDTSGRRGTSGGSGPRPGREDDQEDESAIMVRTLRWYDAQGLSEVFVPWSAYAHADFAGKTVEIGGLKPFALSNPPPDSLAGRAQAFNEFFADLAGKLPSVALRNLETKTLRSGVYRITVDVVNEGYFPTNSALGHRLRWVRDIAVTLDLAKGQSLASGSARQVLDPIAGNGSAVTVSWVVVAPPGSALSIRAESPASGTSTQRVNLR
jgi:hypothetical protein